MKAGTAGRHDHFFGPDSTTQAPLRSTYYGVLSVPSCINTVASTEYGVPCKLAFSIERTETEICNESFDILVRLALHVILGTMLCLIDRVQVALIRLSSLLRAVPRPCLHALLTRDASLSKWVKLAEVILSVLCTKYGVQLVGTQVG